MSVEFNGDNNEYATLGGVNGENGTVIPVRSLDEGKSIGIYHPTTDIVAIGTIETYYRHSSPDGERDAFVLTFVEDDWFRVLHGGQPLLVEAGSYRFAWARDEPVVIIEGTFCRTTWWDDTLQPGVSNAFVDMTDSVWKFGTPYHQHAGRLVPWCMECGQRLQDRRKGGYPATQPGLFTHCEFKTKKPHTSVPVLIWTPRTWYFEDLPQNMKSAVRLATLERLPVPDPFDSYDVDRADTHALTDAVEWFEAAIDHEDPPEGYRPDF